RAACTSVCVSAITELVELIRAHAISSQATAVLASRSLEGLCLTSFKATSSVRTLLGPVIWETPASAYGSGTEALVRRQILSAGQLPVPAMSSRETMEAGFS